MILKKSFIRFRIPTSLLLAALVSFLSVPACAGAGNIVQTGTAAPDTIWVVVDSTPDTTPSQNADDWLVDGQHPVQVGRWTTVWKQDANGNLSILRHRIYLVLPSLLISGHSYAISTPFGSCTLAFDESATFCESIKVNQAGYCGASRVRFACLGIFLGDLGPRLLASPPVYIVSDVSSGQEICRGIATYQGDDTGTIAANGSHDGSGEHVYRMSLAEVPDGGPYRVHIPGLGRSPSFTVGPAASRALGCTAMRGMFHQRCGCSLETPFTEFTRPACHTQAQITDADPPDFITITSSNWLEVHGGYHDAGDFDRRQSHTIMPAWLMTLYEAFPGYFGDGQYNLPESGNGIPDILDEALWGIRIWECLQEPNGGVRAGTETNAHPRFAYFNAATDELVYRTYRIDGHTTASAAGLFAQASRLVRPFSQAKADVLLQKALAAWQYVVDNNPSGANTAQRMYATLHLYLATGNDTYHQAFRQYAQTLQTASWPQQYYPAYYNLDTMKGGMVFTPYFFPYLLTRLPSDPAIRTFWTNQIMSKAADALSAIGTLPYPKGPVKHFGWGNLTTAGRYAESAIYAYRLTGYPKYVDAVSQLGNYVVGLNPLGKCCMTGVGSNPPNDPLHADSWFTSLRGLGSVSGITIYGPQESHSGADYQTRVWSQVYPAWDTLPEQRRFSEGWSLVNVSEFTTWETVAPNAMLYSFLAGVDQNPKDMNLDGVVNAQDLALLASVVAGNRATLPSGGSGDADGNGSLESADLVFLQHTVTP